MKKEGIVNKTSSNKAQVTVFIILGIFVVGIIGGIIYMNNINNNGISSYFTSGDVKPKFDSLRNSISDCLTIISTDAIDLIGLQGGYYKKPAKSENLDFFFIPYYYDNGAILIPDRSKIEEQLSMYVEDNLNDCFNEINDDFFIINYDQPKVSSKILSGEVRFDVDLPIKIQKDRKTATLQMKDNPVIIKNKLNGMYEIAKYITDSHREDAEMLCVNCVADMAKERDMYVDITNFNEQSILVTITDNSTAASTFVYEFLNRYPEKKV